MKGFAGHLRTHVFRGLLAIIPLVLSVLAVQFLYVAIDKRLQGVIEKHIGFSVPGLGILLVTSLVIILLYITGLVASNVIGKQFFGALESLSNRIPLIRTTYQIGKQLSMSLSLSEKQLFQKVVLVELKPGTRTVGFVTGVVFEKQGQKKWFKIFVPTVPNPASGFVFMFEESQVVDPNWTIEEGLKTIISGGIIGPEYIDKK